MESLDNVWEMLDKSPALYFEFRTKLHSPDLENNTKGSINGQYMVDYDKKRAVVFSRIEQSGVSNIVTTLYENGKVHHYYHGLAQDDETQLTREEYCALFEKGGLLFPVNTNVLMRKGTPDVEGASGKFIKGTCQMSDDNELHFTVEDEYCSINLVLRILNVQ
ncbi:MAG: hypothetical protein K2L82_08455 [Lachnospiraceae bacterium]|nr:hypothetical protein [Lachnospiraceae bacterium]